MTNQINSIMNIDNGANHASEPVLLGRHGNYELWIVIRDGRKILLKALAEELREKNEWEDALRKEYMLGMKLNHPNVISVYGFACHPACGNCIEMEFFEGETLADYLRSRDGDRINVKDVLLLLAKGIAYLHSRNIVHRDLKPDNIMINSDGTQLKLIDFGCADSHDTVFNKIGRGDNVFTAPEVKEGVIASDKEDVYSFGVIARMLGWKRKRIIKKCCDTEAQLRPSMSEIIPAIESKRSRLAWWIIAGIIFIALLLTLVLIGKGLPFSPNMPADDSDIEVDEKSDSLHQENQETVEIATVRNVPAAVVNEVAGIPNAEADSLTEIAIIRAATAIKKIGNSATPVDPFEDYDVTMQIQRRQKIRDDSVKAISAWLTGELINRNCTPAILEEAIMAFNESVSHEIERVDNITPIFQ